MADLWEVQKLTITFNDSQSFIVTEVVSIEGRKEDAIEFWNKKCKRKEHDDKTPIPLDRTIIVYLVREVE